MTERAIKRLHKQPGWEDVKKIEHKLERKWRQSKKDAKNNQQRQQLLEVGDCIPQWIVALVCTQQPQVQFYVFPRIFLLLPVIFIDGNAQNSGHRLDNDNQTHLVLASCKLVIEKTYYGRVLKGVFFLTSLLPAFPAWSLLPLISAPTGFHDWSLVTRLA